MNDLAIQPIKTIFNPERDTTKATRAAKVLIDIVKQNGWSIKLGGKSEHLMYEAWQTVGKYYNYTVATGEANPVEIGGISGFKAKAWVVDSKTGVRTGEAEAYCMRDENNWKTKPTFQLASMAQTRAGAKALRQIFGFVVALAGYSPTPAEEMIGQTVIEGNSESVRLVSEKQVNFIKNLLYQKGFTEQDLLTKYKVASIAELTSTQGSAIIENLMKLPTKSDFEKDMAGADEAHVSPVTTGEVEPEIDIDKADEEINRRDVSKEWQQE
ncbi:MAG: hypothetical protein U1E54_04725 [Candidatus Levybacteria bacterium]|nr:hypothetical protein [Candidatus Levybacteria bacterium]